MPPSQYIIGIDLGTTNIVVAYVKSNAPQEKINIFKIPQIIQPGKIAALSMLPSVRYAGTEIFDFPEMYTLPWGHTHPLIGEYAKEKAIERPLNAVVSPKSWLAHQVLDINQKCLPLGCIDDSVKVSPIVAIREQLDYIQSAWDNQHGDELFAEQTVVVTIPASFNDQAREVIRCTLEILQIKDYKLLEEPQAAFYHWLSEHDDFSDIEVETEVKSLALVCDVGGGTTDFSLILLKLNSNKVEFERVASGEHLLLGGDNMDLLLSQYLQQKTKIKLSYAEQSQWMIQVRTAKEKLLKNPDLKSYNITLLSQGSSLLKKTKKIQITYDEISKLLLDGFIPNVPLVKSKLKPKTGLRRIGLPYASESRITQHLADFLINQQDTMRLALGIKQCDEAKVVIPEVVLFNGGVFYSEQIKSSIISLLNEWTAGEIDVLVNNSPSLSVAKGAVYYGQSMSGSGVKIKNNAPLNYFLKISRDEIICILPKGSMADKFFNIDQQFELKIGEKVAFEIFTSQLENISLGQILILDDKDDINRLSEISLTIDAERDKKVILRSFYSSIGMVSLEVVDEQLQTYPLHFATAKLATNVKQEEYLLKISQNDLSQLSMIVQNHFKLKQEQNLKQKLEKLFGSADEWSILILRAVADSLLKINNKYKKSASCEKTWWNMIGYCLRPGVGGQKDGDRIEKLWSKYVHGVQYKTQQNLSEFWVCWRRIASGLSVSMQEKIFDDIKSIIYTRKDQLSRSKLLGFIEKMRLIASLEKISIGKKLEIGNYIIRQLRKKTDDTLLWWMLGRIGNRKMYSNTADIVPVEIVQDWLSHVIRFNVSKKYQQTAIKSIALMLQKTNDPMADIDSDYFELILAKLYTWKITVDVLKFIQGKKIDSDEMFEFAMGEELPIGLTLLESA